MPVFALVQVCFKPSNCYSVIRMVSPVRGHQHIGIGQHRQAYRADPASPAYSSRSGLAQTHPCRETPAWVLSGRGRHAFSGAQAHSQTFFDEAGQRGPLPGVKHFGLRKQSVLNVQHGFHESVVCHLMALTQYDSYELAFADLHHICSGVQLERLVAYHA